MIVKCEQCSKEFDDEFRSTLCPHETFAANDGRNQFQHHPKAFLSSDPETQRTYQAPLHKPE